MGRKQGTTRVPIGKVKQKKGMFTSSASQAIMEVKTVTPDNEICSDGVHKLGHCIGHYVELLHVGRGEPFNIVTGEAAGFLAKKKIQALIFDGTGAEATAIEKHGYIVYMVGVPNRGGKLPVLIRVDSKWAHTHYGKYSGGVGGNGDRMLKTYFAVAPEHAFNEAAVVDGMMTCDDKCNCIPEDKCECIDSGSQKEMCTARVH